MHVVVCVKQVPDTTNVRINPKTNTLMREGVESIVNPFDEYALEEGLRLKDKLGARVTVVTMGPPQAAVVLRGKAGELKPACKMRDPVSGRTLEIWTTEPGMQMYGAQNMTDKVPAKAAGKNLCQFAGVALETQHFPDSPNHPDFPSTVLRPGETFKSHTEYRFGISK